MNAWIHFWFTAFYQHCIIITDIILQFSLTLTPSNSTIKKSNIVLHCISSWHDLLKITCEQGWPSNNRFVGVLFTLSAAVAAEFCQISYCLYIVPPPDMTYLKLHVNRDSLVTTNNSAFCLHCLLLLNQSLSSSRTGSSQIMGYAKPYSTDHEISIPMR